MPAMFVVTEEDEAAVYQRGEFAAAIELRRLFPGITDNAQARECARTIAGWKPRPLRDPQDAQGGKPQFYQQRLPMQARVGVVAT